MDRITYQGKTIHKWTVGPSTFLAWPECGARLMNWHVTYADGGVRDVIYWPEGADLNQPGRVRGGNPILFPFAGRTFDKGVENQWRWEGASRVMPRHGFAKAGDYELVNVDEYGFDAILKPTDFDHEAYPFQYDFSVVYRFRDLSLYVELRLHNRGSVAIPWSAGHHFYFYLPWIDGTERSNYAIQIPAKKAFYHASDGRLQAVEDFETETPMGSAQLVDRIHTRLTSSEVRFGPRSGEADVKITLGADPAPHKDAALVTWTEDAESPFYCVEPWMGPPNSPETRKGLHLVAPGKTGTFGVEVTLD